MSAAGTIEKKNAVGASRDQGALAPAAAADQASSFKMLRAMVGIGVICALLIVLSFEGTRPRIARLRAQALQEAIFKVLPGMVEKRTFLLAADGSIRALEDEAGAGASGEKAPETGSGEGQLIYAGYNESGELMGLAIEASGMGFADILRILYGYDPVAQTLVGFYVLESKETPGLGDKIEKDPVFLANFEALDVSLDASGQRLRNKVVTVKHGTKDAAWQIDAITGATISSRAIGTILGTSTEALVPLLHDKVELFEGGSGGADVNGHQNEQENEQESGKQNEGEN